MTATKGKTTEPTQQDVCIDLPGETVRCWRSSDNPPVVKAVISALLATIAVALNFFAVMFFGAAALSVLVIGTLTVATGTFANYIVEATDKGLGKRLTGDSKLSYGSSAAMAVKLRGIGNTVQRNWAVLSEISPSDYQGAPL